MGESTTKLAEELSATMYRWLASRTVPPGTSRPSVASTTAPEAISRRTSPARGVTVRPVAPARTSPSFRSASLAVPSTCPEPMASSCRSMLAAACRSHSSSRLSTAASTDWEKAPSK